MPVQSVFTCDIPDFISPCTLGARLRPYLEVWKEIGSLPVTHSTLASFNDDLLAIGGGEMTQETLYLIAIDMIPT